MDTIQPLWAGIQAMLAPEALVCIVFGCFIGTLVGALPGLGPSAGVAILLPFSFALPPAPGLGMLISIYLGAMYGGRISSILINTPGESSAIMTCVDGYPLMRQGKGGKALGISAASSFFGGSVAIVFMTFLTPAMASVALAFGAPEKFTVMLFALIAISFATDSTSPKGVIMVLLGLLLATIGAEFVSGKSRLTFGIPEMLDGIDYIAVAVGVFGLTEVLLGIEALGEEVVPDTKIKLSSMLPSWIDIKSVSKVTVMSTFMGLIIGILPGAGATISSFAAYGAAKKISKNPEKFGHGSLEGVAAPEAASNACVPGALAPMMAMGIPGSNVAAIIMGGFMVHDLQPGPLLFVKTADVAWAIIGGLYVSNLILLLLNTGMIPMFIYLVNISQPVLYPSVAFLCLIGVYTIKGSMFDVGIMILFGILGYLFKKGGYPVAGMLLALILGSGIEESFRQSLIMSMGDYTIFFTRPIALCFAVATLLLIIFPFINAFYKKMKTTPTGA